VKINEKDEVLYMIEKPSLEEAKSYKVNDFYLNIAGLLILKSVDSVKLLRRDGYKILGFVFSGRRYDIGTFESLREADMVEQMEK